MAKKVENKLKEEAVEIKVDGNVGLADTTPSHKVEVKPTTNIGLGGGDKPAQKLVVSKEEQPLGNTTRAFRQ